VKQAYIVQQADGVVVAPATMQGKPLEIPFVHTARRESKQQVAVIDSDTVGASFPIGVYDPNTGAPSVKYHAIILYNISSLALDEGRAISLFMQSLILAFLAGLLLFFFLYKLIEHPIASLNSQLDQALREKKDNLTVTYHFPVLEGLVSNINSLLTRYHSGDNGGPVEVASQADEASKIVFVVEEPCLVIQANGQIVNANHAFEQLAHISANEMRGHGTSVIPDHSLQQNLEFLMNRARENPYVKHSDQLEFGGVPFVIECQAFGQPIDYFVMTIHSLGGAV
jgi:PAS domain-containing protein